MTPDPGTYALVLRARNNASVLIGRWGNLNVHVGYYLYVGSAFGPGGVQARVARHGRENKRKHWHIDYLRASASLESVWYSQDPVHLEHLWAQALIRMPSWQSVNGFGCSDCRCDAHLFWVAQEPSLTEFAAAVEGVIECWPNMNGAEIKSLAQMFYSTTNTKR